MTCDHLTIELNRGSDIFHEINCRDDDGNPINMTGWTVSVLEGDAWAMANATVEWTDQANGDAVLRADWTTLTPANTWLCIKFSHTSDGYDDAWPVIKFEWI